MRARDFVSCIHCASAILFFLFMFVSITSAQTGISSVLGTKQARIIWVYPYHEQIANITGSATSDIYVLDTRQGTQARKLTSNALFGGTKNRALSFPSITWDGSRVAFYDKVSTNIYVINQDGTGFRKIGSGYWTSDTWRDASGADWVIAAQRNPESLGPVHRINIDNPTQKVLLWDKTAVGTTQYENWSSLSADGKKMCGTFPWRAMGIVSVPNGPGIVSFGNGCWPSMTRDNSYESFVIKNHGIFTRVDSTGKELFSVGYKELFNISLTNYTGIRWSNDRDIISFVAGTNRRPYIGSISKKTSFVLPSNDGASCIYVWVYPQSISPVKPTIAAQNDLRTASGGMVNITLFVNATPPATLSATGLPSGVSLINGSTPASTFSLSGTAPQSGTYSVKLIATNSEGVDEQTFSLIVGGVNAAPVVNAGSDFTTKVGTKNVYLDGKVSDDGLAQPLTLLWKQLSGPSNATIQSPATAVSTVVLSTAGQYVFELSAHDGERRSADTVKVTALSALPFVVLKPMKGEAVRIGSAYTIEWQMDPPLGVTIELSVDNGKSWSPLTETQAVGDDGKTVWSWAVGSNLAASQACIVRITNYFDQNHYAVSGVFTLTNANSSIDKYPRASKADSYMYAGIRFPAPITPQGKVRILDSRGRLVHEGHAGQSAGPSAGKLHLRRGVYHISFPSRNSAMTFTYVRID